MALAMVLHAPVRAVADAAGLANHQVGSGQAGIELAAAVFQAAVVVGELGADALDHRTIDRHAAAAPAHAQHGAVVQPYRHRNRHGDGFRCRCGGRLGIRHNRTECLQLSDLRAQALLARFQLRDAFGHALAGIKVGDAGLQTRQLGAQGGDIAVARNGGGARRHQELLVAFGIE